MKYTLGADGEFLNDLPFRVSYYIEKKKRSVKQEQPINRVIQPRPHAHNWMEKDPDTATIGMSEVIGFVVLVTIGLVVMTLWA